MNNSDEDLKLDSLLQSWSTPDCAPDFASQVVQRAQSERTVRLPTGRGRLIVPLLLAACLLSAGAFAGWEAHSKQARTNSSTEQLGHEDPTLAKKSRASFQIISGAAHAEPETEAAPASGPSTRRASVPPPKTHPETTPPPERPRQVHLPRCECGIGAIVCSCSD